MAVFRVEKNSNYTTMSNYHLKDQRLSLKSKGLLSLMLSLPDTWDYSLNGLCAICKEGIDAIKSTLKELREYGYLVMNKKRDKNGKYIWEYCIYEKPNLEPSSPPMENPPMDNPPMDKPPINKITKELSTKKLNTKDNNIIIDENFENIWKKLKASPHDRKGQVKPKRKKELYEMGIERVQKAIDLYLKIQDPRYYHRRDRFFNEIIDNYLDKQESDFNNYNDQTSYDLDKWERDTRNFDPFSENY